MQESSKGEFSVKRTCSEQDQEMQDIPSAFHFVGKDGKSSRPNSGSKRSEKRDSGYATDNSPGFFHDLGNNSLQFTFDLESMEHGSTGNSDEIADDKIDEEVEMVLSHQRNVLSVSGPIAIPPSNRPSAPVPRADTEELHKSESLPTFHSYPRHDMCRRHRNRGHYFRPIESRSVGTQTPSPHSQIINDAINDRFHPYLPNAPRVHTRLRYFSEGEDTDNMHQSLNSPLPDIIPVQRDRSVSLPNVPTLQSQNEVEVGRELRRISDEFHFSYVPRRQRGHSLNGYQPSSFPGTSSYNFQNWWETLRQIFTSQNDIRNASLRDSSPVDLDVFENEH